MSSESLENTGCPNCARVFMPWITTCPTCECPLDNGFEPVLATQAAPVLRPGQLWVDIPIGNDEPVKAALLRHFLLEHDFEFEESRRFISVQAEESRRLAETVNLWAFHQDLPDDDRHIDTLSATLREIGDCVLSAVHVAHNSILPRTVAPPALDLR